MSSENSDCATIALSLVAQFDDINRLNNVLNDGAAEECFLAFIKQIEWVRAQWASAQAEAVRLQSELDEALSSLAKSDARNLHVRKLLDGEKRERNIVLKKYNELNKLLDTARDLLFNDNRTKLNDETLQKLAFLNGTSHYHNAKLSGVPELNSTGTLLSEMSYSRSEDDLDLSLASSRRSWVQRGNWQAPPQQQAKKRRSSTNSSATKTVELHGGKVLATATTTLTLERTPTNHDLRPPQNFQPISESSDEAPAPRKSSVRLSAQVKEECLPSAPLRTDTDSQSDTPMRAVPQRTPSVISAAYGASPRARPRQHNFVAKNFYKRETCGPCGKTIKFAKVGVRCESCRAQAHPECRAQLPLPCVPPGAGAAAKRHNTQQEGCISEWAPATPPMVPALLVHCVNEVEKRGLSERGLYRVSGNDKDVKRLKERFLRGCGSPCLVDEDIHVICGCIKDFLRSLREPLVSAALWQDFMGAAAIREPADAIASVVQAVSQLPPPNRDTLAFLLLHLQKVAESPQCEMGVDNLAKVFAPTLIGFGMIQPHEMCSATTNMFKVMHLLLNLPGDYWSQWACPAEAAPSPLGTLPRPKGYFFSPADTGISRKKRNYFQ